MKDVKQTGDEFYKMEHMVRPRQPTINSTPQENAMGKLLAQAISQGRGFELRNAPKRSILLLVTPADDMGHVYRISAAGTVTDIGVTQRL